MRILVAILAVLLVAPAAHAQRGKRHHGSDQTTKQKPKVDEKAYSNALSTLPDKKYDPWSNMR